MEAVIEELNFYISGQFCLEWYLQSCFMKPESGFHFPAQSLTRVPNNQPNQTTKQCPFLLLEEQRIWGLLNPKRIVEERQRWAGMTFWTWEYLYREGNGLGDSTSLGTGRDMKSCIPNYCEWCDSRYVSVGRSCCIFLTSLRLLGTHQGRGAFRKEMYRLEFWLSRAWAPKGRRRIRLPTQWSSRG